MAFRPFMDERPFYFFLVLTSDNKLLVQIIGLFFIMEEA